MSVKLGNSAKDSQYLKRIKEAIEKDKEHPRHHGVLMQAHHLISAKGVKISGMGSQIEKFGYDINLLPNLVFIPCTLQGSCYLGVQPHRGNHGALVDQNDYVDDCEPRDYHEMVSTVLIKLARSISNECPGDKKAISEGIQGRLNDISRDISGLIQNKPNEAPLSNVARYFSPNNPIGCGGADSISFHENLAPCPVERNHHGKQAKEQSNENISYVSNGKYKLNPGR